jgi:hypothetical protein
MSWWVIYVNGLPFQVFADGLEMATKTASVHLAHLAYLSGARTVGAPENVERLA